MSKSKPKGQGTGRPINTKIVGRSPAMLPPILKVCEKLGVMFAYTQSISFAHLVVNDVGSVPLQNMVRFWNIGS